MLNPWIYRKRTETQGKRKKAGEYTLETESVKGLGESVPLKYHSQGGKMEMRPGSQDKKEAVSSDNLRDPMGNTHDLSLNSNEVTDFFISFLDINLWCLWINFPDTISLVLENDTC